MYELHAGIFVGCGTDEKGHPYKYCGTIRQRKKIEDMKLTNVKEVNPNAFSYYIKIFTKDFKI